MLLSWYGRRPPFSVRTARTFSLYWADAAMAGLAEREVELAVGADGADVSLHQVTHVQLARDLRVIDEPAMGVVHDEIETERALARDHQADGFALVVVRRLLVETAVETRAGDQAVGALIQDDHDDHPVARVERPIHFAHRQEQVLFQTPLQKYTDTRIDPGDAEIGQLAHARERLLRGGHETIPRSRGRRKRPLFSADGRSGGI